MKQYSIVPDTIPNAIKYFYKYAQLIINAIYSILTLFFKIFITDLVVCINEGLEEFSLLDISLNARNIGSQGQLL